MFSSVLIATVAAALAPQALANLYITSPVASTSCAAGQQCAVSWNDDGTTPALGTIGACTVGLYVGSQQTQYMLQNLGDVDVVQQATSSFTPDPTIGGNSDLYFLRFTATNYLVNGVPFEGFSAKFTLTGMTGTFNETESSLMYAPTAGGSTTGTVVATTTSGASSGASSATQTSSTGLVSSTVTKAASSTGATSAKSSSTATTSSGAASPAALASSSVLTGVAAVVLSAFLAAVAF